MRGGLTTSGRRRVWEKQGFWAERSKETTVLEGEAKRGQVERARSSGGAWAQWLGVPRGRSRAAGDAFPRGLGKFTAAGMWVFGAPR